MKSKGAVCLVLICVAVTLYMAGIFIGRQINGPAAQDPLLQQPTPETTEQSIQRVDINTADAAQLQTLPGIGEALAQRIIAYRTKIGQFTDVAELLQVEGIGESTMQAILPLITIGG